MTEFSFSYRETALRQAAAAGTLQAAEILALELSALGAPAHAALHLDGIASVTMEGAAAVAREFGTQQRPAQPVAGPALLESRSRMIQAVAQAVGKAMRGRGA